MEQGDIEQMSFEAALAELEQIVRSLEQGQAPLDESIELYQRGDRLKRHCEARLKAAQMRIEQIALGPDGLAGRLMEGIVTVERADHGRGVEQRYSHSRRSSSR